MLKAIARQSIDLQLRYDVISQLHISEALQLLLDGLHFLPILQLLLLRGDVPIALQRALLAQLAEVRVRLTSIHTWRSHAVGQSRVASRGSIVNEPRILAAHICKGLLQMLDELVIFTAIIN